MKNITNYAAEKYAKSQLYTFVEEGIYIHDNIPEVTYNWLQRTFKLNDSRGFKYKYRSMLSNTLEPKLYVTSLSFEQEPGLGEGTKPSEISKYPIEDILDKYLVHISDFYEEHNNDSTQRCYQEFASPNVENVKNLRQIIGKHVYENKGKLVIE